MPGDGKGQGGGESIARVRVLRPRGQKGRLTKHRDMKREVQPATVTHREVVFSGPEVPRFAPWKQTTAPRWAP